MPNQQYTKLKLDKCVDNIDIRWYTLITILYSYNKEKNDTHNTP